MRTTRVGLGLLFLVVACSSESSTGTSSSSGDTSSSSSSSGGSSGQCADCGPCGIAGPMTADGILIPDIGADAAGVAAVGIDAYAAGECKGQSKKRFLLRYAAGAVTLAPRQDGEKLKTTVVSTTVGTGYVWSDRDLATDITRPTPASVKITFEEGSAAPVTTTCTLAAGTVTCS